MTENETIEYDKTQSRKWKLVLLVLLVATVCMLVPTLLSAWLFKAAAPLILISGTEWVSVVTLVVSAYFGANVWQKNVESKANVSDIKGATTTTTTETSESKVEIKPDESGEA